jgi:ribosomal protein S12 methylthiotransferase
MTTKNITTIATAPTGASKRLSPKSPEKALNVYTISLGCPKNRVDTERLLGALGPAVQAVEDPGAADLALINTCSFIQPAVEESVHAILETTARLGEEDPASARPLLAVAGCLVNRYGKRSLASEMPEIDLWLSTRELGLWPEKLARAFRRRKRAGASHAPDLPELPEMGRTPEAGGRLLSTGPDFAYLKIAEGCSRRCAFCTIPSIRGALVSRPVEDLVLEAQYLLDQGVKELVLVAQDTSAYGRDLGLKHGLETLLEKLLPLPGLSWLRLMYLYPSGMTESLLRFLAGAGKPLLPYFDVPLQHAHPEILKAMGRPFTGDPRRIVDRIRNHFPEAALRTSLITGFPGETAAHFKTLKAFVSETRFNNLGVFAFQSEEGTRAAAMDGQVSRSVKTRRRNEIMAIQADVSRELLAAREGEVLEVLVGEPHPEWPGLFTGRTWFQAPEADGVTYVSGPGVKPGRMVRAEVEEAHTYDLVALT